MKKSELQLMIRKIVREEVALSIQEVISELKQPTQSQAKPQKKIVEKRNYSSNSVLNDVLNETAMDDEWKTLGGGKFDSSKINDVVGGAYADMMGDSTAPTSIAAEMGVNPNDPAMDFLKKDYRSVMKKVEEKTKQKTTTGG